MLDSSIYIYIYIYVISELQLQFQPPEKCKGYDILLYVVWGDPCRSNDFDDRQKFDLYGMTHKNTNIHNYSP